MALREDLLQLHELQKVDYQLYLREQALKGLDSGESLKALAVAVFKRFEIAQAEERKAEGAQRDRELELKGVEDKRAQVHEKLYSGRITNPKELGDLQKEEELLDEHIGHLEEAVLALMEVSEAAQAKMAALTAELESAKRRWKELVARTQAETTRLQAEIAVLKPERARLAVLVESSLLRHYDDIRSRRQGIGLAVTGNESCPPCQVRLPPHTLARMKGSEELTHCDNCGRILLWVEG